MSVEQSGAAHQALDRAACRLESSPLQENEAYDLIDELVCTIMKDGRQVLAASF